MILAIKAGNYYNAACAVAGIGITTFERWMSRGKAKDGGPEYKAFVEEVETAKLFAEGSKVIEWHNAGKHDYRAHRDFLERRHPERWGRRDHLTLQGEVAAPQEAIDLSRLTSEEWELYKALRKKIRTPVAPSA